MAKRAIIRMGDPTSHGGTVLEAFPTLTVYGKNAAGIGHRGVCPLCKRDFVIVAGAENFSYFGKNVAVEGMYTSCGAVLIATQGQATVDDTPGGNIVMTLAPQAADKEATTAETMFNDKFQLRDENGQPLGHAEYLLIRADGRKESGVTDVDGHTHMLSSEAKAELVAIHLGDF